MHRIIRGDRHGSRWAAVAAGVGLFLAACQPSAAPAPTAAPAAAKPTDAPKPATGSTPAPAGAPAGATGGAAPAEWNTMLEAAKKEGTVNVALPAAVPGMGDELGKVFTQRYGIKLEYTTENSPQPRVEQEFKAGKVTTDVIVSGAIELLNLYPSGALEPIAPKLVLPEVTDGSNWAGGAIKWSDKGKQLLPIPVEWVHGDLFVNAKVIDPKSITTWQDLLKPDYKGKIVLQDPGVGAGGATARDLLENFGPEYITRLYKDQQPLVTKDAREVVDLMARGSHPIALAVFPSIVEQFKKEGFDLVRVFPTDGKPSESGGSGVPKIIKNSPHPNAAAVFVNWLMSKEGQEIWARVGLEPSRRVDVVTPEIPEYIKPKPGVAYRDQYDEEYYLNVAPKIRAQVEQLLGR